MPLSCVCLSSLWPGSSTLAPRYTGAFSSPHWCPLPELTLALQPCPQDLLSAHRVQAAPSPSRSRLAPSQATSPLRPRVVPKSQALGSKMQPLSQPETMSGQHKQPSPHGAQSSQSLNVWAHWLLCWQPGPGPQARAARILGPRPTPAHTPPAGQPLFLGVLWPGTCSLALVREAETEK